MFAGRQVVIVDGIAYYRRCFVCGTDLVAEASRLRFFGYCRAGECESCARARGGACDTGIGGFPWANGYRQLRELTEGQAA